MVTTERCRKLIDDLRESPDDRTDRRILREFADELTELERVSASPGSGPPEWRRVDGKPLDIRFPDQLPGQTRIDDFIRGDDLQ